MRRAVPQYVGCVGSGVQNLGLSPLFLPRVWSQGMPKYPKVSTIALLRISNLPQRQKRRCLLRENAGCRLDYGGGKNDARLRWRLE